MKYVIAMTTLFYLGILGACDEKREINVWYKVSTDELNPGKIVELDMSAGWSFSDGPYIYLIALDKENGDQVTLVFPNGGQWVAPEAEDWMLELDKEFRNLEEYLKNKPSTSIEKK